MPSTVTWEASGGVLCSQPWNAAISGVASPTKVVQTRMRASSKVSLGAGSGLNRRSWRAVWADCGVTVFDDDSGKGESSILFVLSGVMVKNSGFNEGEGGWNGRGAEFGLAWEMALISWQRACAEKGGPRRSLRKAVVRQGVKYARDAGVEC